MNVPASEVLDKITIFEEWKLLGGGPPGPPPNGKRYKPFWRDGESWNVSLSEEKGGVWYDFGRATGGGKLDLIQKVLDCDKRTALRWLADQLHVDVDQPLTPGERHALWQRRRRDQQLQRLRRELIRQLTVKRNSYWDVDRLASNWARDADPQDWRWEVFWLHARDGEIGDRVQAEIERIEAMTLDELAAFFESCKGKVA
jgi:hypothetical protein